jgi:uncharacterized DUF497 family protein
MRFTWDEQKHIANLVKHGLDFADFEPGFSWDRFLVTNAKPGRDQRIRFRFVGRLFDRVVVAAIVSPLGSEALSIISLRTASMKERKVYEESF